MNKHKAIHFLYSAFFKPLAFKFDAEFVHNRITHTGEILEKYPGIVESLFAYKNSKLKRRVLGIEFDNPIGLAAGFDYDGHLAQVLKHVGFGFNTIGTVTYSPYEGNKKPRLARLPKSKSLLVNKGFKSEGALTVAKRLDSKNLKNHVVGISVGSREGSVDDIVKTFQVFGGKKYVKYFELNISCPNIPATDAFSNPANFEKLVKAIKRLELKQPIFVKMPNEIDFKKSDKLVEIALKNKIRGFVFSNLVKDRKNKFLNRDEVKAVKNFKGNFSGKPTFENSNKLIAHARKKFGNKIAIIGTGGIFDANDAKAKFEAGADLIQLITGMIFEGPQLIGKINRKLMSGYRESNPN